MGRIDVMVSVVQTMPSGYLNTGTSNYYA